MPDTTILRVWRHAAHVPVVFEPGNEQQRSKARLRIEARCGTCRSHGGCHRHFLRIIFGASELEASPMIVMSFSPCDRTSIMTHSKSLAKQFPV